MNFNRSKLRADILDKLLPLAGASHDEVESYFTDVPMRYTECFARLVDGRTASLRNKRQFIGSCGLNGSRSLLFQAGSAAIEIAASTRTASFLGSNRQYTSRDGSLQSLLDNTISGERR